MIIKLSYSGSNPQKIPATKKISMIKAVRTVSDLGLKCAKDLVDRVVSGRPQQIQAKDDSEMKAYKDRLIAVGFDCAGEGE